jgi:hypothetical protein
VTNPFLQGLAKTPGILCEIFRRKGAKTYSEAIENGKLQV